MMGSLHFDKLEDFAEEQYASLPKRPRFTATSLNQLSFGNHEFPVPPSQYNPLDEPSPLGLKLRKSPSLLDLIQMRLSQGSKPSISVSSTEISDSASKKDVKGTTALIASSAIDKLKASNFPASLLRIGSWEYVSKYEGDLVAKCYFAKNKLVWEVLEGGLKSKIEIQWSDITALKADFPEDGPGTLTLVLARQPLFFRETNPQPRKHTLWQAASDFTDDGQASINRKHYIECPPGVLNKHYEKLIQCDMRLNILSRQPEIVMESPYFESQTSVENSEESKGDGSNLPLDAVKESPASVFEDAPSAAAVQLSSFDFQKNSLADQHVSKEAPSPSSVMDTPATENRLIDAHDSQGQKIVQPPEVPGLRPSKSMNDLMNHIGNCISEQMTSGSLPSECQGMLENIAQVWLSDTQHATGLDEKSLMKKVNSLCCLLQDPAGAQADGENDNVSNDFGSEGNSKNGSGFKQASGMTRKDSLGDLLFNLPRIASLPKFSKVLFGIAEDDDDDET